MRTPDHVEDGRGASSRRPAEPETKSRGDEIREEIRSRVRQRENLPDAAPTGSDVAGERAFSVSAAQRQRQIRYIQEFFESPSILELRIAPITTSSSREEIEQRRKELLYRLDVLEAMLTLLREELALLDRIEISKE